VVVLLRLAAAQRDLLVGSSLGLAAAQWWCCFADAGLS
jgi:hypothetical protein